MKHRGHASWRALRDARERSADISLALRLQDQRLAHKLAHLRDCAKAVDPFPPITVKLPHTHANRAGYRRKKT